MSFDPKKVIAIALEELVYILYSYWPPSKYLDMHQSPTVSVEIDAVRLAEHAGEPLDVFHLAGLFIVFANVVESARKLRKP